MAGYTFVNAYAVNTALTPAGKEQNSISFATTSLGQVSINDGAGGPSFSGNDVSAIGINIGGQDYYGWISRPIKANGVVRGFYFWTDPDFTNLATAQADGNRDGDGNPYDNIGFVLVVDQAWFNGVAEIAPGIKNVGSSSDRVDSALNSIAAVNHAPVAVADSATAVEAGGVSNGTAGSNATGNVLLNDTDVDAGDTHKVVAIGTSSASSAVNAGTTSANGTQVTGQFGTLTLGADGTFSYAVNNANPAVEALRTAANKLTDTFTYKMVDSAGASSTTTLTVTIQGANDAPTANNDYNVAKEATTVAGSGFNSAGMTATGNVLANDTDKDSGDTKAVSGISVSTTGTTAGDSITFSTAQGTVGKNKYVYASADGTTFVPLYDTAGAQLQTATVSQSADKKTLYFASTPNAAALALLNGTNDLKTFSNAAGSGLDATLTDTYTWGGSATVSVTSLAGIAVGMSISGSGIPGGTTVTAVNQAASTITLSSTVSLSGAALTLSTSSISGTGTTFYGDHGTLVLKSDGSYVYTPKTDDPSISSGQSANDVFHYTMQDAAGATSSASLTVTVYGAGANDPVAVADTATATEAGMAAGSNPSGNVLTNDSGANRIVAGARSVDTGAETAILSAGTTVTGRYGTLTIKQDGTWSYALDNGNPAVDALNAGNSLSDVFVYRSTNAPTSPGSAVSTLTITINGANDAPVAHDDFATAIEKGGLNNDVGGYDPSGNVLANDTDVDNPASDLKVSSFRDGATKGAGSGGTLGSALAGAYGSLTLNADGSWSYAVNQTHATVNGLAPGETLTDSFNYTVSDGKGGSDIGVLTVTIQGAADTLGVSDVFVNEASPYAIFRVTGVQNTAVTLALSDSVGLAASDTPATLGVDLGASLEYYNGAAWVAYGGSATIPSGGTLLVRVAIHNDTTYEGNESFSLTATSVPAGGGHDVATATGIGTINDEGSGDIYNGSNTTGMADGTGTDDDRPTISISGGTVTEGDTVQFLVSLDRASTEAIHFTPALASGTATVGTDTAAASALEYFDGTSWVAVSGPITIAAGSTQVSLRLATVDDDLVEGAETFTVSTGYISDAVKNQIGATATVTILDNDTAGFVLGAISGHTTESGGTATFTVKLASQPTGDVVVTVASDNTAEGTITGGATLTFTSANWNQAQTVTVKGVDDTLHDGDVDYHVTLTAASADGNYNNLTSQVAVTNDDNDTAPVISIGDVTVNEGDGTATFTVTRTGASGDAVTVDWTTVDGTAQAGSDYVAANGTLSFAAGETSKTITISIVDDNVVEGTETFTVHLSNIQSSAAAAATIGTADGTATIQDNDVAGAGLTIGPVSGDTTESGGTATFTIKLNSQPTSDVTVTLASDNTAEGTIISATTLTFTSANWNQAQTVTVKGVDDTLHDGDIGYHVNISTSSADSDYDNLTGQASLTNLDNDTAPVLSIDDVTVNEGDGTVTFTVTRTGASGDAVTVDWETVDGTAQAGSDYVAANGTLSFAAGETSKTVTISIVDDHVVEGTETFTVHLSNIQSSAAAAATIGTADGTATIVDDDTASHGLVVGSISGHTTESGGTATFTVKLASQPTGDVVVTVASDNTAEGTITGGATLTFTSANWNQAQTVTVKGVDDTLHDGDVDYHVTLTAASSDGNYDAVTSQVSVTNLDNDTAPVLSIDDVTVNEGDGTVTFTVTRTGASGDAVTVDWTTVDGTAQAGSDYVAANGTLSFAAGETSKTITISIIDDHLVEGDETFTVHLSNIRDSVSAAASIGVADGTATIQDNDTPGFALSPISGDTTESGGTATFTIRLTTQPTGDVVITVGTDNAAEGTITSATTLTFTSANWNLAQMVTVRGVDDDFDDGDILYHVTLAAASSDGNYDGLTRQVDVINLDDDSAPQISIGNVTVNEGDGTATFTVTRTGATGDPITVDWTTVDGSAKAGSDYVAANGTLSFAAGETSKTITISIIDDHVIEGDETFIVRLSNIQDPISGAATIATTDGTATILDNDTAGFVLGAISGHTTESGGTATFTVKLASQPTGNVVITVASDNTAEGTITGGVTLTFTSANWNQAQTVTVTGVDDTLHDGDVDYHVTLTAASADGNYNNLTSHVAVTNDDNDTAPVISIGDVTVNEGDGTATFTVTRTGASGDAVTVDWTTVDGTAQAGSDYVAANGTLSFAAGETSKTITISIVDDNVVEGSETFTVRLSNIQSSVAAAATIGTADGTATIQDNDTATLQVTGTQGVSEGSRAVFTIALSNPIGADTAVTITLGASSDTASAADYSGTFTAYYFDGLGVKHALAVTGGVVTLTAGVETFYVSVDTVDDSIHEGTETFTLTADSTVTGPASGTASIKDDGTGKFYDDKGQPTVGGSPDDDTAQISVTGTPDTSEGSNAVFSITLSNASASATEITLTLGTGADTADASDYSSTLDVYYFDSLGVPQVLPVTAGKISLPAGVTQFYVSVATTQDSVYEGKETFTLSAAITGGDSDSGTAGIVDDGTGHVYDGKGVALGGGVIDDDRPTLSITALSDVSEGSNAIYTVRLSNASTSVTAIAATLGALGDTASAADYSAAFTAYYVSSGVQHAIAIVGGVIQLPAGVTTFYVKVPTINDTVLEGPETVTLGLAIAGGSSASATATIVDNGTGRVYDDVGMPTAARPDDDRPAPPSPPTPPTPGFGADLNPASDDGVSNTDKITSIIDPVFTITAPGLLQPGQAVRLVDPQGQVVGVATVGSADAQVGHVDVRVGPLDDGVYRFTAQLLDAAGRVVAQGPVSVTIVTDLDGVMPSVELAANGGDFNKDGIPDWQQNNVAQLPLASLADFLAGKMAPESSFGAILVGDVHQSAPGASVVLDPTAQLMDISLQALPGPLPANMMAASAVFNFAVTAQQGFVLHDVDPTREGLQTRVVIDLPAGVNANAYVKWDAATASWVPFMDDGNLDTYDDGATLIDTNGDGRIDRVVITLTDGRFGDADGIANGIIRDPGMLVLMAPTAPTATPVYDVLLASGDHYYSTSAAEAAQMAQGTGNVFQGVAFDSLTAAQGGRHLLDNYNPFTQDWYFAVAGDAMPYACYAPMAGAGFNAAAAGQGPGADYHLYLNSRGITQLVTTDQAQALNLAAQGFVDRGAIFNTTAASAFKFEVEGYLVANAGNQAVQALVQQLSATYAHTSDAGFVEAVEQNYLAQVQLTGIAHGGAATAADVNAAFGTHFAA